jgi:hypothetical protein
VGDNDEQNQDKLAVLSQPNNEAGEHGKVLEPGSDAAGGLLFHGGHWSLFRINA